MKGREKGIILVLAGPPGVGKDTIQEKIVGETNFQRVSSYTTRLKRTEEVDGVHYRFVGIKDFQKLKEENKLLDDVVIEGHHYGLPLHEVLDKMNQGINIIVHLVVESGLLLKRSASNTVIVFLTPPSKRILIKRLGKRGIGEKEAQIKIQNDNSLSLVDLCDFIVVNEENKQKETVQKILNFLEKK